MVRILLVMVCGFAALSSSTAAALGLEAERMLAFSVLLVLLCGLPHLRGAPFTPPGAGLSCLVLLLLAIAIQDGLSGRLDPVDYKVALLLLVLLAAPGLAAEIEGEDLMRLAWRLLALYVVATFAWQLAGEPTAIAAGEAEIVRHDPTGSVIMHASLSLIGLVLALGRLAGPCSWKERAAALGVAILAVILVLQTATRTVIVTLAILACFQLATAANRRRAFLRLAGLGAGLAALFLLYSELWNPSLLLRLTSTEVADYGSGRLPSLIYWLGLMGEQPLGLGFGSVRELLADGKPDLDGESTLEWPHNEVVRFYVEAGPVGLAFVLLLLGLLVRTALLAAARDPMPARRALMLVIAADIVAESLLQNLLNAVYHAAVLVLLLSLAAQTARRQTDAPALLGPGQAAAAGPKLRRSGRASSGVAIDERSARPQHLRAGAA